MVGSLYFLQPWPFKLFFPQLKSSPHHGPSSASSSSSAVWDRLPTTWRLLCWVSTNTSRSCRLCVTHVVFCHICSCLCDPLDRNGDPVRKDTDHILVGGHVSLLLHWLHGITPHRLLSTGLEISAAGRLLAWPVLPPFLVVGWTDVISQLGVCHRNHWNVLIVLLPLPFLSP